MGVGLRVRGPVAPVVERMAQSPSTHFLAATVGRFDLLATVDCPSRDESIAVMDAVRAMPEVMEVETWVHLKVVKEQYYYSGRPGSPAGR
jgi:hypothetical protein